MAKIVVLDVDGTLMDTNYLHVEAWARAFHDVGVEVVRAEVHREIGKGSDKLIPEFLPDDASTETSERVSELHQEYFLDSVERVNALPGASALLESLEERGYGIWLTTSARPEELDIYLEKLDAGERIDGIVNSSDVDHSKPEPDIFSEALERSGAQAGEAVALGDAIWDIEAALGAGIRTVGVLTGGAFSETELREAGAVEVFRDCAAVLESSFPE